MPNYKLIEGSVQSGFYHSRAKIQVFGGAFANGKTTALAVKALKLVKDYPGCNGLLARETYPKLNDTLRRVFFKWCPPDWILKKPTIDDNTCYMKNGSIVNFRYISQRGRGRSDGSATSNLLSATYDWIGVDQVEDPGIIHKDFLDLLGRLRGDASYLADDEDLTMPASGPRWLMLTANPSHNWFYKELIQPYLLWLKTGQKVEKLLIDSDTGLPLMELFESDTYANKANLSHDYIVGLEATYKGQMRDRFLLGKWVAFEGLVHPDYDPAVHTLSRAEAENYLAECLLRHVQIQAVEAYDFGIVSPSCYLLGFVDDRGRVIVLDGFYQSDFPYNMQPQAIRDIRARYAGLLMFNNRIHADPAIFKKTVVAGMKETGSTIAKLYQDDKIYMRPSSNNIVTGIAKVNSYLAGKKGVPHIITKEDPGPMIYFVDDLAFIGDEMSSYYWKQNTAGQRIDEPMDAHDHAMNALKYMLSYLPEVSKIVVPESALPPKWQYWHETELGYKGSNRV
jgi:hypothetical protein